MAKNQKKPVVLNMGGVIPRKSRPETLKAPQSDNQKALKPGRDLKTRLKPPRLKKLPKLSKKKFNHGIFRPISYIKSKFFYIIVPVFVCGLYLFDINRFPPAASDAVGALINYDSISSINSVEYLPVKLVLVLLAKLHIYTQLDVRFLSVFVLLLSLFCFYKLVSSWMSKRMSVVALLLYSTSSWTLFQTRQDTVSTLMLGLVPILLYLGSLLMNSNSKIVKALCCLFLLQLIFVPGAIWFFLVAGIIYLIYFRPRVRLKPLILPVLLFISTVAGYLALILQLSLNNYVQFLKIIGLEVGQLPTIDGIKANISALPNQLFFNGLNDNSIWLYKTPIIDYVSAIFLLAGFIYLLKSKIHPVRKKVLFLFLALAILLIFINGFSYISLLLPLIYVFITIGITYLIDQWLIIFPNNPLARSLGIVLVSITVLMVCGYHIERYFIGWPKTEEYHQIFRD